MLRSALSLGFQLEPSERRLIFGGADNLPSDVQLSLKGLKLGTKKSLVTVENPVCTQACTGLTKGVILNQGKGVHVYTPTLLIGLQLIVIYLAPLIYQYKPGSKSMSVHIVI